MKVSSVGAQHRFGRGRHAAPRGVRRRTVGAGVVSLLVGLTMLIAIVGSGSGPAGAGPTGATIDQTLSAVGTALAPLTSTLASTLGSLPLSTTPAASNSTVIPAPLPTSSTSTASSGPVPTAVTSVTAAQAGTLPDLTVTWVPSATATGAAVQLSDVVGGKASYLTQITCGSCTTTTFRALTFGTTYEAAVFPTNANGIGPSVMSPSVTLTTSCTQGACVTLDATSSIGAANHADAGIEDSLGAVGNVAADAAATDLSMWRSFMPIVPTCCDWYDWDVATGAGAQTTVIMSDLWANANEGEHPPTPWSEWSVYQSWVESTVSELVASGKQINYWEVYNEPGGNDGYYTTAGYNSETPALLLQQFLVTYQAIKAADPSAAVIGPSLAWWSDYPTQFAGDDHSFDMVTFLNYAVANNLQLAGISWHEELNNTGPVPEENSLYPALIEDHVAQARALIAARPSLGNPLIFINEYGMPEVQKIPGWDVEYLSALTQAGVYSAGRGCWDSDCDDPDLDGLLATNGTSPLPDYYDRLVYAAMSGNMLATTSTADSVSALGSYNAATGTITALVGRGVGCSQDTACETTFANYKRAAPTSVLVTLTVPWTSGEAHVAESDISGAFPTFPAMAPNPTSLSETIVPTGNGMGTITISIPSFADGDAYGFTVTQAS